MREKLIDEIRSELDRLSVRSYAERQSIYADPKQLRHLRQLLSRAAALQAEGVADFSRCVYDMAPGSSRLAQLTSEL